MSKKIAVGIVNLSDENTFLKCKKSLPSVDYIFSVHNTTDSNSLKYKHSYNRYISYGGLYNIILREILNTDADYIFLIRSNLIIEHPSILEDYIKTAQIYGTWFMSRGDKEDKNIIVEDDITKLNLCLYENLAHNFIFMLKSHIKHFGFFNEGYHNFNADDRVNCLEAYDYYNKIESKMNYVPRGYFPDVEMSLAKITEIKAAHLRPSLKDKNTDNITRMYGQFYYNNKFIPGQHKTASKDKAITILENIQKIYAAKN